MSINYLHVFTWTASCAATADAKAKKPVSLKKDNGVARRARMPNRLHAIKIYYRARGCWPNNRSHSGRRAGRERKKAQIFNLINIINRLNRLREEFFFILLPSFSHIFCYQLFLKLRILFILVDISSFFLFYFSIIYFFYLPFFSFFNSFYNIEIVLEI